jgi:signal transduction histidine kinase
MRLISALGRALRTDASAARVFLKTGAFRVLLTSIAVTLLACRLSPSLSPLEYSMLDALLRHRRAVAPDPTVAVVGIEQSMIDAHEEWRAKTANDPAQRGKPACVCDTIARDDIAELVSRIRGAGSRVVVLDMFFTNKCPIERHNTALRDALEKGPSEVVVAIEPLPGDRLRYRLPTPEIQGTPEPILASPMVYNRGGGDIRGVELVQIGEMAEYTRIGLGPLENPAEVFPALGAAAYAALRGQPCDLAEPIDGHQVRCAGRPLPVGLDETIYLLEPLIRPDDPETLHPMLISWAGPPGTYPMYAASAVLRADPDELRAWFGDKAVLIGSESDRNRVAVRGEAPWAGPPFVDQRGQAMMSGPEVHANVLDTMLRERFVRPVSHPTLWLVMLASIFCTVVAFRATRTATALTLLALEGGGFVLAAQILIARDRWLYTAIPMLSLAVSGAVAAIWGYAKATSREAELQRQLRAIDGATATTVHDLKQPLAAISALAATLRRLQERGRLSDAPEILQRIENQVGSALGNINDLLVADPDRPIRLHPQPFDVAALARDLATTLGLTSGVHQVEVFPPDGQVMIEGDPQLIGRVLNNLIENAIKYSPAGGRVTVEVAPFPQVTVLRVKDQGIGIPPDRLEAIFERYERALPEGTDIPGTGIGLYSVKRLVEAHGGRISARSELGVGSVFTVTLQAKPVSDTPSTVR